MISHFALPPDDDDDGNDGALMMHCENCNSGMFTMEILEDGSRLVTCAFVHCQTLIEVIPPPR
ncbi:hypothetical protein [Brevundimonas sp. NPDC058933]|uniref:hypothetical protein n=1 Tax=Brevundimonas sp. NPDC058933 TaxID=3346673 RepID=UPI003BEECB57